MAVVLSLRDIHHFSNTHRSAYGDTTRAPILHFNTLFCCLFGLAKLPKGLNPVSLVCTVAQFLRSLTRSAAWFVLRVRKLLWAHARRRGFLREAVLARRARLKQALGLWEAQAAQRDRERRAHKVRQRSRRHNREARPGPKPKPTPPDKMWEVVKLMHQNRLRESLEDARIWVRHKQDLKAELLELCRRFVGLWVHGACTGRETMSVGTRLVGLRERLKKFSPPPCQISFKWDLLTATDLERLEVSPSPCPCPLRAKDPGHRVPKIGRGGLSHCSSRVQRRRGGPTIWAL